MNLEQILKRIEIASDHDDIRQRILTCGATHLAQDSSGEVFGYKGEPEHMEYCDCDEWQSGSAPGARVVIFAAKLDAPENWKVAVWELP
jgi:hypothetical protein